MSTGLDRAVDLDQSPLEVAVGAERAANAAEAAKISAVDRFYSSRMAWPGSDFPGWMPPAHRSVLSEVALALAVSEGVVGSWLAV